MLRGIGLRFNLIRDFLVERQVLFGTTKIPQDNLRKASLIQDGMQAKRMYNFVGNL